MKFLTRFLLILGFPFIIMIVFNEWTRSSIGGEKYQRNGVEAMNTVDKRKDECTWACHQNTGYCKRYHVKFAKPYFEQIDPIYFGIINSFQKTGNYSFINVLVFVIAQPLLIAFLVLKSLDLQTQIKHLKNKKI